MIEIFSIFSYNSVTIYVAKVKKLILATKILKKVFLMLTQKDIDNLEIKDKRYMISVGEPKELYVRVNPTGKKVFYLRASKFKNFITIGECQKGVLNVTNAREKAKDLLNQCMMENLSAKMIRL
ncbi:hypothetical protein THJ097_06080 [Campylobacter jejuni]|nr:hypothetical protein THJ097_06080 [Campylobacter jejuni]GKY43969.1 hypothetical protein THJ077_02010 [Campylobacter jejuni]